MKRWIHIIGVTVVLGVLLWLTGCATARGMGEDLESAGKKVQDWSE